MTDTLPTADRTAIALALRTGGIIDITTTGRRTGEPRRIEIVFHHLDGRIWITGLPGKRAWYANLADDPRLTFHLKAGPVADLPARAALITDAPTRQRVLTHVVTAWNRQAQLDAFLAGSPLIEVTFDDPTLLDG